MSTPAQKVSASNGRREEQGIDWAEYARSYDVMAQYNRHYAANIELVSRLIRNHSPKMPASVCDLGAGTGNYLLALWREGLVSDAIHLDASYQMNDVAVGKYRSSGFDAHIVQQDVTEFALNLPECDVYLCVNCMYAIPSRDELVRRLRDRMPVDSVLIAVDFGRRMRISEWIPSMLRTAFSMHGALGVSRLLRSGVQIAKHNSSGAEGQELGVYWLHSLHEFEDLFVGHGLELVTSGVCYKGYCDFVVVRR